MAPLAITGFFAAIGLLFVWMAQPLIRRQVGPNATFGLRVHATLADPVVWYDANERAGRDLQLLGFVLLGGAVVLPPLLGALTGRLLAGTLLVGLVVLYVHGHLVANRIFRERAERLARAATADANDAA